MSFSLTCAHTTCKTEPTWVQFILFRRLLWQIFDFLNFMQSSSENILCWWWLSHQPSSTEGIDTIDTTTTLILVKYVFKNNNHPLQDFMFCLKSLFKSLSWKSSLWIQWALGKFLGLWGQKTFFAYVDALTWTSTCREAMLHIVTFVLRRWQRLHKEEF